MSTKTPQSTPATRAAKRPKGAVMYVHPWSLQRSTLMPPAIFHQKVIAFGLRHTLPVAVIPCRTAKEARALVKLHGEDAMYRLQMAVADWVESAGGKVLMTGPVQTIVWPGDAKYNFTVGIKCTGRKPIPTP